MTFAVSCLNQFFVWVCLWSKYNLMWCWEPHLARCYLPCDWTGWTDIVLRCFRASWTHAHPVTEGLWVWFYTWMATLCLHLWWKKYIGSSSSRAILAKKGCQIISLLASNQHWQAVECSFIRKQLLTDITSRPWGLFPFNLFYRVEKWRWEAVGNSGLEKKSVQHHHSSFS